jgi:glycosyltransferase involved in cell wall biosynthesis
VVIQAWAHGLSIVAAASRGPSDLITDGLDGLLVPIDDDAALARAAGRLLAEPDLRAQLTQAGAGRVAGEFSKARVVAQWRELLGRFGAD